MSRSAWRAAGLRRAEGRAEAVSQRVPAFSNTSDEEIASDAISVFDITSSVILPPPQNLCDRLDAGTVQASEMHPNEG